VPKLFAKFVRATNANKQNIYGTGLGLYIAKEIVNAHNGRIWAESDGEGKGSTFFIELDMAV
jgi:signal transduction histidine kinase